MGKECIRFGRKKVVDLNDKNNINQLSKDILSVQGIDEALTQPIHKAISVLKNYEETHELSIEQIRKIYDNLNINEQMSPEEMDHSLKLSSTVAIIEKKFLRTCINKVAFSSLIRTILQHFINIVEGPILAAITEIIENFSCICLMAKNQFFYKDVCFKFFSKHPESGEILVLVLNIHYEQTSLSYKILNLFKLQREKIHLNFLGALVKTDLPPNSNSRVHSPNPMVSSGSCGSCGSFLESSSDATNSRDSTD
jgi:hypothetical protein